MDKIRYVVGFLFSSDYKRVVLINKNRPEFQKGLYNGVGGRIEEDELPIDAMIREFYEETDVLIENWKEYAILDGDCVVHVFAAYSEKYSEVTTKTDERVEILYTFEVPSLKIMPNLRWLIPMALDANHVYCTANFI